MNAHTITFDKLVYLDRLKSAGVPEDVARAHADGHRQLDGWKSHRTSEARLRDHAAIDVPVISRRAASAVAR